MNLKKFAGKKRKGIAERAPQVLMFVMLFNLSLGALNSSGWLLYKVPVNPDFGALPGSTANPQYTPGGQSYCSNVVIGANSATCKPQAPSSANILTSLMVFGDWFGGIIAITYAFFIGVAVPGAFLFTFGMPWVWATVFTAGMYALWFFLILWLRTGRPV